MVTQHPFTIGQYIATWAGVVALAILMAVFLILVLLGVFGKFEISPGL